MTDKFVIGNATLYCGDCRDIVPSLPKVDAAVSDPPYGINYNHDGGNRFGSVGVTKSAKVRGQPKIYGDNEPFDPQPWINLCGNVLLFGADHFYPRLPESGRFLAWNKLDQMEPWDSFSDVEFMWHSKNAAARIFNMKWKGVACDKWGEDNGLRLHPTQKPIRLMCWCLEQCGLPKLVLDPYMGSGTTGVACAKMGLDFIGIDIDKNNFDMACRRVDAAYAQGQLFVPEKKFEPEQAEIFSESST